MKVLKNVVAITVALMLLFALCVPAFATEHSYVAYQIFSGTQSEGDDTGKLGDIKWGKGIAGDAFLVDLKKDSSFTPCVSAQDVARVVSTFEDNGDAAHAFAKLAYQYRVGSGTAVRNGSVLDPGYYLIVDVTKFGANETNTIYNLALLQLTQKGEFEIKEKTTVPTVSKEVKEDSTNVWQDAADYAIGEAIPIRLSATISDIRYYDTYEIVFNDSLSAGLTYNNDMRIVLNSGASSKELVADQDYTITVNGGALTIAVNDLRALGAIEGDSVVAEYTATLNNNAVIGDAGNPNNVYLQYSNNPNDPAMMGKTPTEEIEVYTWSVDLNKVTELHGVMIPLAGAEFELFDMNGNVSLGKKEVAAVMNGADIVSYTASFEGLDAGSYELRETKTPAGYNSIKDPIAFTIASGFDGENVTSFSVNNPEFTANQTTGRVSTDVVNMAGVVLPETGGMGTTIFYVLGATMLTLSVVLFVTKKRVAVEG